jgi:transcriptional regulator with XRE-family HTH domain
MAAIRQFFSHVFMDIRRIVGENVRRYRLAANLSQEEMAARMEYEQGYVSGLEAGRRNPTIVTLAIAADALGIKPSLLLETPGAGPLKKMRRSETGKRRQNTPPKTSSRRR